MRRVTRTPVLPGIKILPSTYRVVEVNYGTVEVTRPDGFTVFFDRKKGDHAALLNKARLALPPENVMRLVGTIRGYQIAIDYARKYNKTSVPQYKAQLKQFTKSMDSAIALGFDADKFLQTSRTLKQAA